MVDVTLHMLPMPAMVIDLKSQRILSANVSAGEVLRLSPQHLAGRPVDDVIVDWSTHMSRAHHTTTRGARQFASCSRRADNCLFQGTWRIGPASTSGDHVIAMLVHYPVVHRRDLERRLRAATRSRQTSFHLQRPLMNCVDHLTGLGDRWVLEGLVEAAITARSERGSEDFGLLFVDLDDFKNVNDRFGHACGDRVLAIIAERLVAHVRPTDHVTRYGGDEFVIYAEPINSEDDLRRVAGRITTAIAEPIVLPDDVELRLSASIGMAVGGESPSLRGLVETADRGMYAAKRSSIRRSSAMDG
jgi:diguanylate cyclase (GGDEF)-like protein